MAKRHIPEWVVEPIEEGKHYGALYEAFSEEDAMDMAKEFLSRQLTKYDKVNITSREGNRREVRGSDVNQR